MKNKSGGAMPSFLLNELNGSEEDDSDKEIKDLMLKNEDSRSSLPNSSILLPQHQAGKNLSIFLTEFCLSLKNWIFSVILENRGIYLNESLAKIH